MKPGPTPKLHNVPFSDVANELIGNSRVQVANKFDCNYETIERYFKDRGLTIQQVRDIMQRKQLQGLVKQGMSIKQIAYELDRSYHTVYALLRRLNIKTK